jgi:hypothetical protein
MLVLNKLPTGRASASILDKLIVAKVLSAFSDALVRYEGQLVEPGLARRPGPRQNFIDLLEEIDVLT